MSTTTYTGGKVPFGQKLAFGVGGICNDLMGNTIMVLAVPIFNVALGLDARWVGLAMGVPLFWAAFTDPLIGNISDNTRSRFGRRKPYMLLGSLIGGILFPLIWYASPHWSQPQLFAYIMVTAILFYTLYSVFIVPYNGLASELTMDVTDRTRVMAYLAFFGGVSGLFRPWAYRLCFTLGKTELEGVKRVGILIGLLIMASGCIPALFCRENPRALKQPRITILTAFRETTKNRPFLLLAGIMFFILMGIFLVQPMALYISIYYLFHGDRSAAAHLVGLAGSLQGLGGIVATPLVAWLGTRLGKVRTLLGAQVLLMLSSLLSWVLYCPHHPYLSLGCVMLLAPAMTCVWILLGSMLADCCDYDELQTGLRREGVYGAIYSWIVKGSTAGVLAASGFLVAWAGVDPALPSQTPEAVWWIRLLFAVIPAVFTVASFACAWHYPLTEQRMHAVRAELNSRQLTAIST